MFTYSQANERLGNRSSLNLEGNTTLQRVPEGIAVRFHNTDIVVMTADGTYILNTGGFRTSTTKKRINKYAPVQVHQRNFEWFVGDEEFKDGMRVRHA